MEKKKIKKTFLNKRTVTVLNPEELDNVKGGWVTTIGECTHFGCCCSFTGCGKSKYDPAPTEAVVAPWYTINC